MICFIVYFFADPTIKTVGFRFFCLFSRDLPKIIVLKNQAVSVYFKLFSIIFIFFVAHIIF
jgi:hypothetical protein